MRKVGRSWASSHNVPGTSIPVAAKSDFFSSVKESPPPLSFFELYILIGRRKRLPHAGGLFACFLAYVVAHQAERPQQGRPILEMGGEDSLHGIARPGGH